ncbi:valyl-trna synthetase [Penicillium citrinum]|uniref:Valyl-trna synthetase n=2 Tax=Penicillium TaxID=5073 RepID=A0A9W9PAL0_PENCI|nr:valyl-trna synthetase [Penicillium citrinum]KAJ5240872.1 valyl-trna synthetase [Penicillium citrinum]KAJ5585868.1 valyl-trna synthetase [Penicillium hetheringtonii]
MAQNSASHNPIGLSVGNLTEPPPPVDEDTKAKISEAVEKDPTGEGRGGPGEDDLKKSDEALDIERERAETATMFARTNH